MKSRNAQSKAARTPSRKSGAVRSRPAGEKTPRLMTEDEADILYCEKHKHEKGVPLKQALEELGIREAEVGL